MLPLCLLLATLVGANSDENPELRAAATAVDAGRYYDVLTHLKAARARPLSLAEQVRAFELEAVTHAAFGRSAESIEAFRQALIVDPSYRGPLTAGPKLQTFFATAQRMARPAPILLPPTAPVPLLQPVTGVQEVPAPFYRRWWFWTGVVAVAAGVTTATVLAHQRHYPSSTLGNEVLP